MVLHNVKRQLRDDALSKQITKETYSQFCSSVKTTLLNYSSEIIDRTIISMDRRIDMVIKSRGQRILNININQPRKFLLSDIYSVEVISKNNLPL